jgi:two-component system chemotaxis response regulator CheB
MGAVDFVTKPRPGAPGGEDYGDLIAYKIRAAASARVTAREPRPPAAVPPRSKSAAKRAVDTPQVLFFGASTGGTHAIQEILQALPATSPPILIVQHMPEKFSRPLAERLDAACEITVKEAEDGEPILPGHAYIGPGDLHFLIRRSDAPQRYIAHLAQAEPVNLHRPSVDILFRSAAKRVGKGATGVLLTGGGRDGAEGLLDIKLAGGRTIVQDEATSVVFGMPREAIAIGAAQEVLSLPTIARRLQGGPGAAS